jgi:hypothetical protein
VKRRDFLKLIGAAAVAPSVLAGRAQLVTGVTKSKSLRDGLVYVSDFSRVSGKNKRLAWSSVSYWWSWGEGKWVPIDFYNKT